MNRPPATSVVVSVILGATMWLFISWFQQPLPLDLPEQAQERPSAIAPSAAIEAAPACADVEHELQGLVEDARACSTNKDCVIFDYGYPIQCMASVARDSIPGLRESFSRYHDSCEYRVYYDCPTGKMVRLPVCRQNRCEVDLVTPGSLSGATPDLPRE